MRVRIDAAGHDVLAARIDHGCACGCAEGHGTGGTFNEQAVNSIVYAYAAAVHDAIHGVRV